VVLGARARLRERVGLEHELVDLMPQLLLERPHLLHHDSQSDKLVDHRRIQRLTGEPELGERDEVMQVGQQGVVLGREQRNALVRAARCTYAAQSVSRSFARALRAFAASPRVRRRVSPLRFAALGGPSWRPCEQRRCERGGASSSRESRESRLSPLACAA